MLRKPSLEKRIRWSDVSATICRVCKEQYPQPDHECQMAQSPKDGTLREKAEKLYNELPSELGKYKRHVDVIDQIESALHACASEARRAAIEQVLAGIAREQQYHEFLESRDEPMRHPVLACKEISSYVKALLKEKP
ncbi:unnamed protein product [Sphagnum balticum]